MFDAGRTSTCHVGAARETHFGHDVFVTRKGAVRAREGDLVEIVYTLRQVVCVKG